MSCFRRKANRSYTIVQIANQDVKKPSIPIEPIVNGDDEPSKPTEPIINGEKDTAPRTSKSKIAPTPPKEPSKPTDTLEPIINGEKDTTPKTSKSKIAPTPSKEPSKPTDTLEPIINGENDTVPRTSKSKISSTPPKEPSKPTDTLEPIINGEKDTTPKTSKSKIAPNPPKESSKPKDSIVNGDDHRYKDTAPKIYQSEIAPKQPEIERLPEDNKIQSQPQPPSEEKKRFQKAPGKQKAPPVPNPTVQIEEPVSEPPQLEVPTTQDETRTETLLTIPQDNEGLYRSSSNSSLVEINGRKDSVGHLLDGSRRSSSEESLENTDGRREGVPKSMPVTEKISNDEELPEFPKTPEEEEQIKKAIEKNEFLTKILSAERLKEIIRAMQLRRVSSKKTLIKQGDKGSEMFVSKEGKYRILIKGKVVGEFSDSRVFGELAMLYNAKRLATIQAVTQGQVWVLDRHAYQKIVISSNLKEQDEKLRFLQKVEYLNVVDTEVLRQVSNLLNTEFFHSGEVIIRQGDKGDKFYIIRAGTVTISKTDQGVIGKLKREQCFGEKALQKEDTRQATVTADPPGVECLTLARRNFIDHFGDIEIPMLQVKKVSLKEVQVSSEYKNLELGDLKIIRTLGVGGFGRVELVQHRKQKNKLFALKYLKKFEIVYQNQQQHVYNEKTIQMNCNSLFIVQLYRTYKDNKYVYFLMETCLGGDLFSLLHNQKNKRFEEEDAKFLSACVIEAFEHLHSKGIVYRDLKPENLLVAANGYLKLTDFGFAKKMPSRGKTFTFAGTPEYIAPEIVLNRGHDRAVDYWAFGAFVYELLTGRTPFKTGDATHMRTYTKILNGIDNVKFPSYFSLKAKNLVEKLCRPVPSERLGMQRGATKDIKAHKWYQGFDWQKFQQQGMTSRFKPNVKDYDKNFDVFKQDKDYPPDETSGWDIDF